MKIDIIIPAAGQSKRFKNKIKKQFFMLNSKPIIELTVNCFRHMENIGNIIIAVSEDDIELFNTIDLPHNTILVKGGKERAHSVYNALVQSKSEYVMVHDGARPFLSKNTLNLLIENYRENSIVLPALIPNETVRIRNDDRTELVNRDNVYLIQTPQFCAASDLKKAMKQCFENDLLFTDEAEYISHLGGKIIIIDGDVNNIKITSPDDIMRAEYISKEKL